MRATGAAALLAFALTLAYAAMLQPEWEPQLNDQQQYLSLARGLVERGEFTRAGPTEAFIPETKRLPGYPILIAPTCLGGCDHWRIAVLQAGLIALLVCASAAIARRVVPRRAGSAAFAVALYVPYAYFGALALSDVAGAALFTLGVLLWLRSVERASIRDALAAGAFFGWAALMRGAFVFAPIALAAPILVRDRRPWRLALATTAVAVLVLIPYIAYSEASFGRPYAGNSGTVLWFGAIQGLDEASLDPFERAEVEGAQADVAAFDAVADRHRQALAWLDLDDALGRRASRLIAHDPLGWTARGVLRTLELFDGDRLARGGLSGDAALAFAAIPLVLAALGVIGLVVIARRGGVAAGVVLVAVLYVWIVAVPFSTEGRYSLPARPFLLIAAVALLDRWSLRTAPRGARPT